MHRVYRCSWWSSDIDWGVWVVSSAWMTLAILLSEAWRYLGWHWLWECCETPIVLVNGVLCDFVKVKRLGIFFAKSIVVTGEILISPVAKGGLCFFIDPCRRHEGFVSTTNLQPVYTNTVNDVLQWAVWTATDAVECLQRALGTREMCLLSYRHWKGPFGLDSIEKRQFKRVRIWNKMGSLGCNHDIDQRAVPRTQSSALEHRVWLN